MGSIETPPSVGGSEKETASDAEADKSEVFRGKMNSIYISETLIVGVKADGTVVVAGRLTEEIKGVNKWENMLLK